MGVVRHSLRPQRGGFDLSNFRDDGQAFGAVRSILIETWDPLGVNGVLGAANEYDRQAMVVVEMLDAHREMAEVAEFLLRAERDLVGPDADAEICTTTAAALVALRFAAGRAGPGAALMPGKSSTAGSSGAVAVMTPSLVTFLIHWLLWGS